MEPRQPGRYIFCPRSLRVPPFFYLCGNPFPFCNPFSTLGGIRWKPTFPFGLNYLATPDCPLEVAFPGDSSRDLYCLARAYPPRSFVYTTDPPSSPSNLPFLLENPSDGSPLDFGWGTFPHILLEFSFPFLCLLLFFKRKTDMLFF